MVIDTPRGSTSKYKFDTASGLFRLSRILPPGLHFPCDFGFIPGTVGDDGDALDVAVLGDSISVVGCLLTVRLLGMLKATQIDNGRRIRNDRFLGVPVTPVNVPAQRTLRDIPRAGIDALEDFFTVYNRLQGRIFHAEGREGVKQALRALRRGIR